MQQEIEILNAIKSGFRGRNIISTGGTAEFFRLNDREAGSSYQSNNQRYGKGRDMAVLPDGE